jgi:cell volume regulation protein A
MTIECLLLVKSLLILINIAIAKLSDNLGDVPALLLFLVIGMLAGSEGPGGSYFDNAALSQSIGVIALVFILFSGGYCRLGDQSSVGLIYA